MNAAALHISNDLLESYAMGSLSDPESEPLEEHLLLCSACQARLDELDEFVHVIKAALMAPAPPTLTFRIPIKKPKRWELHCCS